MSKSATTRHKSSCINTTCHYICHILKEKLYFILFNAHVCTYHIVADDEFWCDNTNRSRLLPQSLAATQAPTVMITQPPVFTGGASTQIVLASFIVFLTMLSAFLIH